MGFERVFRSLFVSDVGGWRLEASWFGVGAGVAGPSSRTFCEVYERECGWLEWAETRGHWERKLLLWKSGCRMG